MITYKNPNQCKLHHIREVHRHPKIAFFIKMSSVSLNKECLGEKSTRKDTLYHYDEISNKKTKGTQTTIILHVTNFPPSKIFQLKPLNTTVSMYTEKKSILLSLNLR